MVHELTLRRVIKKATNSFVVLLLFFILAGCTSKEEKELPKPNILMIIADDLNQYVGHLEGSIKAQTPNIDALAEQGVSFMNAYCASPQCNPSRASFFSGMRPHQTGVYANGTSWQNGFSEDVLLTTHFQNNEYYVAGGGKTHGSVQSVLEPLDRYTKRGATKKGEVLESGRTAAQSWAILDGGDEVAEDEKTVLWIEEELKNKIDSPFFLMAGLYKPHLSWKIPKQYYDLYPLEDIQLPPSKEDDHEDLDMNAAYKIAGGDKVSTLDESEEDLRKMVRGYLAAVSYCDAQVGRIMSALQNGPNNENTIVVLWGDHGYHLGEKHMAAKRLLWEEANRVPYIWIVPSVTPTNVKTNRIVDLMSAYPTLCELAGLPIPKHVSGRSIAKILRDSNYEWEDKAFSTYWPGNHTIRTPEWRYCVYDNGFEELYDKSKDELEYNNLAKDPKYLSVLEGFRSQLPTSEKPMVRDKK